MIDNLYSLAGNNAGFLAIWNPGDFSRHPFEDMPVIPSVLVASLCTMMSGSPVEDPQRIIERAIAVRGQPSIKGDVVSRYVGRTEERRSNGTVATVRYISLSLRPRARTEYQWEDGGVAHKWVNMFDGERLWMRIDDGLCVEEPPENLAPVKQAAHRAEVCRLQTLTDRGKYTLTALPPTVVEEEECVGVRVVAKGQPEIDLYFGAKSYILRKVDGFKLREDGKQVRQVDVASAHKPFQGVMVATKRKSTTTEGNADRVSEEFIESVEFLPPEKVPELFRKP